MWKSGADTCHERGLSYIERPGKELPIVFLHGSGFSKEVFKKQFVSGVIAGHRLIAVDLPGHGQSPDAEDPGTAYSYAGLASAVTAFVNRLDLERCIVVGWSLGGHVAYEMLDVVPQVAGVMAFGAPPAVGGPLGIIRSLHISRNLLLVSKARFSESDAERFERVCLDGHCTGEFVETLQRTDVKMRPNLSRSVMGNSGPGQKERVEKTQTPVCLLHGRRDPIARAGYIQSIKGPGIFRGQTIFFDDSGHAPFIDAADDFDNLLKQFADFVAASGMHLSDRTRAGYSKAG